MTSPPPVSEAAPGPSRVGLVTAHRDRRVWQQTRALLRAGWEAEVFPARELATLRPPSDLPRFEGRAEGWAEGLGRRTRNRMYGLATRLGMRWAAPAYHTLRAALRPLSASITARHRDSLASAGYRILIAHDLPVLPLCASVAKSVGARLIYDSHELYPEQELLSRRAARHWVEVEAAHIGAADLIVTVSRGIAEELVARYRLSRPPLVLPNVCDWRPAASKSEALSRLYELPSGKPVVLCQGGLMPGRGLELVVEAWAHLEEPRPLLVFLGEGPMAGWIQRRAARLRLGRSVFVGRAVGDTELSEYTSCADLGLIPYRAAAVSALNTRLSCPNRLFEYLMARLPVLAWDLQEIRRVLDESGTGVCATWQTAAELASLIQQTLSWRLTVSAEALEAAARRFSFEHYGRQWLAAVGQVQL